MTESNFPKKLDMLNSIGLKATIDDLMLKESKFIPVADVCKKFTEKLNEGFHEEELIESFITELAKVATNDSTKQAVAKVSAIYETHKSDIETVKALYEMQRSSYNYIVPMIESAVVNYITNKNSQTRETARQTLYLFEGIPGLKTISENMSFEEYEERSGKKLINSTLNESKLPVKEKTYTQAELDEIVNSEKTKALNEAEEARLKTPRTISSYDTHIDLSKTISNILTKESKNESLRAFCEQYIDALNSGKAEENLYESFISGVSNWNYLNAVDTELSALSDRISKYKQDIDLKKILNTMKGTGSYYIVPLIEGVVVDWMNNKSMTNKAILKQRLEAFEYDPFVRDILNVVQHDLSIENTVYLGESVELLNNKVHTEKIYSPVLYIKENECVFNVKGTYYDRKGNSITKLSKSAVQSLDESFKSLCNVLNSSNVVIDEAADCIKIYMDNDVASVSESAITLNNDAITTSELENIASMSHLMNEHKEGFYNAIRLINENYDKIAYIDFVKRVALNESDAKTVDVFRIKNNIFVNTADNVLGKSTFYRNINPMQCRNYINEHMEINVTPLFEDILPNQESIQKDIDETKKQYEDYIKDLEDKKAQLEKMKDDADDDTLKDIESAVKLIDDELTDVKDNYKTYQKESDEFTGEEEPEDADKVSADDAAKDIAPEETPAEDDRPAEETPSDAEVSTPLEDTPSEPEATPYDDILDAPAVGNDSYEIVKVAYQENVKTGKKMSKGEVYLLIPSVSANGDIHNELKTVTFYLDPDRNPIINNEYMPLAMYNAIKKAVQESPDTMSVEIDSSVTQANEIPVELPSDSGETLPEDEMFGLEDDSETLDSLTSLTDDLPSEEGESSTEGFDSSTGPEFSNDELKEPSENEAPEDDTFSIDDTPTEMNDLPSDEGEIPVDDTSSGIEETPAETAEKKPFSYPVDLGLDFQDIAPIKGDKFKNDMESLGINYSTPEGFGKSGCCITVKNKADAYALKDYFREWKNFSDEDFNSFFPELQECFASAKPTNESVKILHVQSANESVLLNESANGGVSLRVPYTDKYIKVLGLKASDTKQGSVEVVTESFEETADLYKKLKMIVESSASEGTKINSNVKKFLKKYRNDFRKLTESDTLKVLETDYSNLLESKISANGFSVGVSDDNKMHIPVTNSDRKRLYKIFESYYKDNMPKEISDFFQNSEEPLKEGIKITIKDDKTGKTIELDTDNLDNEPKADDGQAPADAVSSEYTTFNPEDSQLFGSADDSSDDADNEDEDKKKSSDNDEKSDDKDNKNESEKENSEEEKPKKKLKFKVKKKVQKSEKTEESVKENSGQKPLNESVKEAELNVYDWVKCGDKFTGQIIAKQADGNFIVSVNGSTVICPESYLTPLYPRIDAVDVPVKFDMNTLKALHEQMVQAGMFMNNNRITSNDCFVKYSEYKDAKDEDDIRLVVEGQTVYASKKYVRVLEDENSFANPDDYIDGVEVSSNGDILRKVKINKKDYETAVGSSAPVKTLVNCETEECKLIQLPKGSLLLQSVD